MQTAEVSDGPNRGRSGLHLARMRLSRRQDVIHALPADAADDTLGERVLPGWLPRAHDLPEADCGEPPLDEVAVNIVSIPVEMARNRPIPREGLRELLRAPFRRGAAGDIDVQLAPAVVAQHDEAVERSKRPRASPFGIRPATKPPSFVASPRSTAVSTASSALLAGASRPGALGVPSGSTSRSASVLGKDLLGPAWNRSGFTTARCSFRSRKRRWIRTQKSRSESSGRARSLASPRTGASRWSRSRVAEDRRRLRRTQEGRHDGVRNGPRTSIPVGLLGSRESRRGSACRRRRERDVGPATQDRSSLVS
jgi:hypothetical protein